MANAKVTEEDTPQRFNDKDVLEARFCLKKTT